MTQISRPQSGLRATYPDAGAYTGIEWAERIAPFHSGDYDDAGVIPTIANYLNVTDDGTDITIDTGDACVHGHVLLNDASVVITPTTPGAPDTYTVVAVQNDTTIAYNTNLDTPAPYAGGIPAYSTRLAILQDTTLIQDANHWMIPLATFDISAVGAITNLADARLYVDTYLEVDSMDDMAIADVLNIGTHAVTDSGGDTGMGAAIRAWLANAADTFLSVGRAVWRWSVPTAASERSRFELRTMYQSNEVLSGVVEAPDTASPDGNARGIAAVDWQGYRALATEIASGDYSVICGGRTNTASGTRCAICGGYDNLCSSPVAFIGAGHDNSIVTGDDSVIGGGNTNAISATNAVIGGGTNNVVSATGAVVSGGGLNVASASYATVGGGSENEATATRATVSGGQENIASDDFSSIPGGLHGVADKYSQVASASGRFAADGDAQGTIQMVARKTETHGDNTWRSLFLDGAGAAERMVIAASTAWTVDVLVVGITQNAAKQWSYQVFGLIERDNAGNTTMAASATTTIFESDANFDAQLVADDANEALVVQVQDTGAAGDTVRWVATVRLVECTYP